ncbi:MAG: tyrosine-type recombinase/integrase [Candidatus Lokiarchaeota archaeon]|nr:tyrosine-type recombinase/integrase [Candidatus Lokiarchaeota archaeon]
MKTKLEINNTNQTNDELIEIFLKSYKNLKTRKTYKYAINHFLKFVNDKNLQLVDEYDLEDYYQFLRNSNYRSKTKQMKYSVIVNLLRYFTHLQLIDYDNSLKLSFAKTNSLWLKRRWNYEPPRKRDFLTNEEIKLVLGKLKKINLRDYILFFILADTSMRASELSRIRIGVIHFNDRIIETSDTRRTKFYAFGKNLKRELLRFLEIENTSKNGSGYLLRSENGEQLSNRTITSRIFPKIGQVIFKLTRKKITSHSLRISFKINRIHLGQNREQIEVLMNYKNDFSDFFVPTKKMLLKWFDNYEEL